MGKNILTKELLLRSVDEWNAVRNAYPDLMPDLQGADFRGLDFSRRFYDEGYIGKSGVFEGHVYGKNSSEVNLNSSNLRGADFRRANLSSSLFREADLQEANLSYTNLSGADLSRANLRDANLNFSDLSRAKISGADFSGAEIGLTTFGKVDLSSAIGLDTVRHSFPSTLGIDTIYASNGEIPDVFLRGCGLPDAFIQTIHELNPKASDYYSCFISHSSLDKPFVDQFHDELQAKGVRCYYDSLAMQGGKKVLSQIEDAIHRYDKFLLILSQDSMNSEWVKTEIIIALQKKQQSQKEVLFPVRLVPFEEIKKWKCFDSDSGRDLAREIREYHIPDFSLWGSDQAAYKTAFERLLKDLKQ